MGITCRGCGRVGRPPSNFEGGRVRCPECGEVAVYRAGVSVARAGRRGEVAAMAGRPSVNLAALGEAERDTPSRPLPRITRMCAVREVRAGSPANEFDTALKLIARGVGAAVLAVLLAAIVSLPFRSPRPAAADTGPATSAGDVEVAAWPAAVETEAATTGVQPF